MPNPVKGSLNIKEGRYSNFSGPKSVMNMIGEAGELMNGGCVSGESSLLWNINVMG